MSFFHLSHHLPLSHDTQVVSSRSVLINHQKKVIQKLLISGNEWVTLEANEMK